MRFRFIAVLCLLLSLAVHAEPLRIATWGGDYGAVFQQLLVNPYRQSADSAVHLIETNGPGLNVDADVVELEFHDAIDACDRGILQLLPWHRIAFDSRLLIEDFVPNTLLPCAVGQTVWSTVFAFDATRFSASESPTLISDFFDTRRYPGKRALRYSPRSLAEWVLALHAVPVSKIYSVLERTDFSWQLIENALNDFGDDVIWVDSDAQALAMIENGEVAFAMVHSDAALKHSLETNTDVSVVWDAAITQMSLLAIPGASANFEQAWEFLSFATSAEASARFSAHFGYGPARYSALGMIDSSIRPYLPGRNGNLATSILGNSKWWRQRGGELTHRFSAWLLQRQVVQPDFGTLVQDKTASVTRAPTILSMVR